MSTYTVRLDGLVFALAMDANGEYIYSLEAPCHIAKVQSAGVTGRNRAVRSVCRGYELMRDAERLAKRCGDYRGTLPTFG